jgi:general secretion pathway protein J
MCSPVASPRKASAHAGFTLVEVLVAVTLLGTVAAMVFASLLTTTQTVDAGRAHAAREQTVRKILRLMAEEIAFSKRSITYPWVGMNGTQDGQPADTLAILAMSQEVISVTAPAKESDTVRVVYTRERDRLIRFVRKNLFTVTDTNESLDQMELADNVLAFNVRYYDEQNRIWLDEWPNAAKLPKALLLEVTFQYPESAPWTIREWVTIGTS